MGAGNNMVDDDDKIGKVGENLLKRKNLTKINVSGTRFFDPKVSIAFTFLSKTLTKAPILYHFDPEHYIQIETIASDFAIGRILYQLNFGYVTHINLDLSTFKIG